MEKLVRRMRLFCIYVCSGRTKGFGLNEDTENREKSRDDFKFVEYECTNRKNDREKKI